MSYQSESLKTRSEKIQLVKVRSVQIVKLFTIHSGSVYYRDVDHFVESVKDGNVELTEINSVSLSAGQWFYDKTIKRLYVRTSDSSNPKTRDISIRNIHFFSSASVILPYDLTDTGYEIEWESRIESIGSIGQRLDDQSTGIVLESSSSIALMNNDGYFDDIYDTHIWENQTIEFYSWFGGTQPSEAKRIFNGLIDTKDFNASSISFKVRDFVFKLQNTVNLGLFSELDGDLDDSAINKPKRRIYGQVKQVKCTGVDKVLDGYPLTGTFTGLAETESITGTGTQFLKELSPGDKIVFTVGNQEYDVDIQSVESDTAATVSSSIESSFVNVSGAVIDPSIPYRFKNREWHVAGHKLRAPSSIITNVVSVNRFDVNTSLDMYAGDQVDINGDLVTIRRISGNQIVTQSAVAPTPVPSDTIEKFPIQRAYFGSSELIYLRDYTIENTTEAKIIIDELAEFNIAGQRLLSNTFQFTNGSRSITTSATLDLRSILSSRDWIRKSSITETAWYEILEVKEQEIIIRTPFSGTTQVTTSYIKNITHIDDDALITCDCMGMDVSGDWIKTPADAVRHLVLNDSLFPSVNEASFTKANSDCNFILSMPIPESELGESPKIRDVITKINESVFGSLYGNASQDISYSILNAQKPELSEVLYDDDIVSFDASSNHNIANIIKCDYRPFIDRFTGNDGFHQIVYDNEFVNNLVGVNNTIQRTIYLYEEDKATIIAQRIALFSSMSNTTVKLSAKMNVSLKTVNDKIFLSLDRLYKRFGGGDKRKIGVITGVKKDGYNVDLEITDLNNIYNRVPAICPNTTLDYSLGSEDDFIRWGYVLDNDVLTPDPTSEDQLGNNVIG